MDKTFGAYRQFGDTEFSVSGCHSAAEAVTECYCMALDRGWRPAPLRQHWWQIWRPQRHETGLVDALVIWGPLDDR